MTNEEIMTNEETNEETLHKNDTANNNDANSFKEEAEEEEDEFRSHSFRERRLTYSRHHILSDTAAAAVAELLAEGDFSDDEDDDEKRGEDEATAAVDNTAVGNNKNGEAINEVSTAAEKGGEKVVTSTTATAIAIATTKSASSPQQQVNSNNNKRRRGSASSANSDTSNKLLPSSATSSVYLPSRILHAGEIVRRYSIEQQQQGESLQNGSIDEANTNSAVATTQQQQQHDVRTGAYSHPTHHATSKKYIPPHHHQNNHHTQHHHHQHRNKWRQRFSFCSTTPDYILPFPRHVVGTFSCHGMEPVYDSDYDNSDDDDDESEDEDHNNNNIDGGASSNKSNNNTSIAKINQDRGGIIYPYANSHSMALFAVYDGHGEGGELVSQFALGEISRILSGRLVQYDDGLKQQHKKQKQKKKKEEQKKEGGGDDDDDDEKSNDDPPKKKKRRRMRRRGMMMESVQEEEEEESAAAAGDDDDEIANNEEDEHNVDDDDDDEQEEEKFIEQSLKETFIKVDRGLLDEGEIEPMYSGTTACVVLKRYQKLYIANCGDSRAVLARRSSSSSSGSQPKDGEQSSLITIPLSIDQNPDSPGEKERILHSGGYVSPPPEPGLSARVWLDSNMTQIGLAMARSIGDHAVKGVGVIAEPVVSVHNVDKELDEFVIIASDGVWEFISSEDAVDIVGRHLYDMNGEKEEDDGGGGGGGATEACEALIKAATAKWHEFEGDYRDDITAMVIRLKDLW